MAAQYVEAIRTVDPHGPYRLAGYSAGGMIALEMAQQLKKAGAQVALLAMIDTLSPTAARRKVSRWKKLWLMRRWSLAFAIEWPSRRRRGQLMNVRYALALEKLSRGEPLLPGPSSSVRQEISFSGKLVPLLGIILPSHRFRGLDAK